MVNLSPLRVGSGKDAPLGSPVDLAVIRIRRNGRQEAYVPGSSLKGLFRSQAEPLLRLRNPRIEPCSGLAKNTCMDIRKVDSETSLHTAIQKMMKGGNSKGAMELFFRNACLLCKIFGAPSYSGRISFSDAYPLGELHYGVRTGIAIDRRTGAVYRGQLYQVEYVEPGARFNFAIRFRNLPNYSVGLLAKLVRMLRDGEVRVGGFKTRGFGFVTLEKPTLRVKDYLNGGGELKPIEQNIDRTVSLGDIVSDEGGYSVARGDKAWMALRRFEEVWDSVNLT